MRLVLVLAGLCLTSCIDEAIDNTPFEVASDTIADRDGEFDAIDTTGETVGDAASDIDDDSAAPIDSGPADTTEPYVPPTFDPEAAAVTALTHESTRWAGALLSLGGEVFVVAEDTGWRWVDAAGNRPITDLAGEAMLTTPVGIIQYDAETALISDGAGLWTLRDATLGETPLAEIFEDRTVVSMVRRKDGAIWFSTDGPLYRLKDDLITSVSPTGLVTADATLADGAEVGGAAGLWVASAAGVYALSESETGLNAWPEQPELIADALASDGGERVWVVSDATLWRRRLEVDDAGVAEAFWGTVDLGQPVRAVAADGRAEHAWFIGADGGLFHHVDGTITEVTNAPSFDSDVRFTSDSAGRLIAAGKDGVTQIAAGRVLNLLGVNSGSRIDEATVVTVRASTPDEVTAVSADIDGDRVDAVAVGDGAARTWHVMIDPQPLTTGAHVLTVAVTYGEAESISTTLAFTVLHITWVDHIEPLYERRCSACHNEVDGASTAIMTTSDSWRSRYDCIVCRVTDPFDPSLPACVLCDDVPSSMPPTGPISRAEVELIERWGRDGFREGTIE